MLLLKEFECPTFDGFVNTKIEPKYKMRNTHFLRLIFCANVYIIIIIYSRNNKVLPSVILSPMARITKSATFEMELQWVLLWTERWCHPCSSRRNNDNYSCQMIKFLLRSTSWNFGSVELFIYCFFRGTLREL